MHTSEKKFNASARETLFDSVTIFEANDDIRFELVFELESSSVVELSSILSVFLFANLNVVLSYIRQLDEA
jgi:hypothetical protein